MDNNHCAQILFVCLAILFSAKGTEGRKRLVLDWKMCGGTGYLMTNITTAPNPIETPGKITVSADIIVNTALDNVTDNTIIEKKTENGTYVPLPCQGTLSGLLRAPCESHDFCAEFTKFPCSHINDRHQPCDCPLQEGTYRMHPSIFDLTFDRDVGEYRLRKQLEMNGTVVGCMELDIIVKKVLGK